MHVEKRKDGKQYLAHSFREGKKVHKIRKYLGKDLKEIKLKERMSLAKTLILNEINQYKVISDPIKKPLKKEEIDFIKKLEKKQEFKIFHFSEEEWKRFSELFTYNTNAIEGSELQLNEVKNILEKDKWPKEKSKEDIAEAYGVDEAISFIRKTKEPLSLDLIKKIHKIVFKNSKTFAGNFREKGQEVAVVDGLGKVLHTGAPQTRINHLLNELIKWYKKYKKKYPALVLAAVVHNQFENIHPFADGNGRVGRILLNYILLKHHFPPINIRLNNRKEYYASLQEYEKNNNLRPTLEFLIKEYKQTKKQIKGDHTKK